MTTGWPQACRMGDTPFVPVIVGTGSTQLEHAVGSSGVMRLYLLDHAGGALAIEIDDVSGGAHLDTYSWTVSAFQFAG
ncbi:MAG: hypothetical protein ABI352_09830 [Candidatus Dormibacter sp.]